MPTTLDLSGVGVLITRPAHQAGSLRRSIEAHSGNPFLLPAMEIKPHPERRTTMAECAALDRFDLIIFTSANAVRFGADFLEDRRDLTIAAIGPATARALNQAGYRVSVIPAQGFDTESLLAHSRLAQLHGRSVLLIKGAGGREALGAELTARGAEVKVAEVYVRAAPAPTAAIFAALEQALSDGGIQVVTVSSLELAVNLAALVTPAVRNALQALPWIVPSGRVAAGVRKLGVHGELVIADSAEDRDMLGALLRWRSGMPGV